MVRALTSMMSDMNERQTPSLCFEYRNHTTKLLNSLSEMRSTNMLTDVILLVEGQQFPAHKNVLAASSEFFKAMFLSPITLNSEITKRIEGLSAQSMELILDYLYQGKIEITEQNVEDILVASRMFLLEALSEACCKYLQVRININNCWGIRHMADKYSLNDLFVKAHTFIEDNFAEAKASMEFLALPLSYLMELMNDDELNIREDELATAVLRWIEHDTNRKCHLEVLFKQLRLKYISQEYLEKLVRENRLVLSNDYLVSLIKAASSHDDENDLAELISERELNKMNTPRKWQRIVPMLTAVGGTQNVFYNPEEKMWISLATLKTRHCPGLASVDTKMYLVGGSHEWVRMANCQRFCPEQNIWEDMTQMNVARSNIGLVYLEKYLYSIGGYDGNTPSNRVERYDVEKNEWSFVASMNNLRDSACVVADSSNIFAISGFDGTSYLSTMDVYDPAKDIWTCEGYSCIRYPRQDAMTAHVDGKIYVIGGYHNDYCMSSGEVYDIEDDTWGTIASMSGERNKAGCAALNRKIYVCGGWEGKGKVLTSVEFYDTETDCWTALPSLPTPAAMRATFLLFPRKQVDKLTKKSKEKRQKQVIAH